MSPQIQEFTFDADRDAVLTLFTGEQQRSRTIDLDYGGDVVQVKLFAVPINTGDWGIVFYVEFKNPEVVVSANSRTLKVAMIELAQSRRGECRTTLRPLKDTVLVRRELRAGREWAWGVGQDIIADLWRQAIDEWPKRQPAAIGAQVNGKPPIPGRVPDYVSPDEKPTWEKLRLMRFHDKTVSQMINETGWSRATINRTLEKMELTTPTPSKKRAKAKNRRTRQT